MKIDINADDIERLFKEELLKAGLGAAISKGIASALSGFNSPIEAAIKEHVRTVVQQMLREEPFVSQINESIRKAVTVKLTAETLDAIADATLTRIESAARERY